jgi:hypothetical protein
MHRQLLATLQGLGSRSLGTSTHAPPAANAGLGRAQTTQSKPSQTMGVASGLDRLENLPLDWRFLLVCNRYSETTTSWSPAKNSERLGIWGDLGDRGYSVCRELRLIGEKVGNFVRGVDAALSSAPRL